MTAAQLGKRANPYRLAVALAAENPRLAFWLLGGVGAVLGVVMLIALSSIQAFLMISQQSSTNARTRFIDAAPIEAVGVTGFVGDAVVALAGEGLPGILPGVDQEGPTPAPPAPSTGGSGAAAPTAPVTADDVVSVHGIRVHRSIADDVRALIDAAAADGITLSGWGWRDGNTQIRLRREHCGTSEYAIYRMPSSQCRPPTARPGRSQHERGLAIDFTYNGGSMTSRSNPGFVWLNNNAHRWGFVNLPSEPWHWSVNGR